MHRETFKPYDNPNIQYLSEESDSDPGTLEKKVKQRRYGTCKEKDPNIS